MARKKGNPKRYRNGGKPNAATQRVIDKGRAIGSSDRMYIALDHSDASKRRGTQLVRMP